MSLTFSVDQSFFIDRISIGLALPASTDRPSEAIKITCFPEWYSHITLQWNIPSSWGDCKFNVYFSAGGSAEYVRLNNELLINPHFKDLKSQEYSRFSNGNYVVEAILPGNRHIQSKPVFAQYKRRERIERIASEIQRREYMLLSKFAGIKSFYFKRRNYGLRCQRCWSHKEEKVMDDHCGTCYGTSWQGGYFDPIPVFIQFEPTPSSKVKGYHGDMEPNSLSAWTISVPDIHSDDVIIRSGDFSIYKVISVATTELQTRTVRQTLSLTQLSKSDVENDLANRTELGTGINYISTLDGRFVPKRFPTNLIDLEPENDYKWAKDMELINLPKYEF